LPFSSYSHRFFIYGPFAALLALAIGYSIYWRSEASELSAKLDAANQHDILPGLHFAFAEKSVGGYPFRLDVVLSGVTFSTRGPGGETAWRTEKLAIHALAYGGGQYLFEAAGLQSIAYPAPGVPAQVFYVTPGTARASALVLHGKLARFDLDIAYAKGEDATASAGHSAGGAAQDYQPRDVLAQRAQFHARREGEGLDLDVSIDSAKLGAGYNSKLGHQLKSVEMTGVATQADAFDALLSGSESLAQGFADWRKAGGAVRVDSLSVTSESAMNETLKGSLALNADGDLAGTLSSPSGLVTLSVP
jgi:hypothetical protein